MNVIGKLKRMNMFLIKKLVSLTPWVVSVEKLKEGILEFEILTFVPTKYPLFTSFWDIT